MDAWGLAIGVVGLLLTVLGVAAGATWQSATVKEKVRALEHDRDKMEGEMTVMQAQLARGDTRFATLTQSVEGMRETLAEIKVILTEPGGRLRRGRSTSDSES